MWTPSINYTGAILQAAAAQTPTTTATPTQMRLESLKELDRMRMISIQALAMQRIRDSVTTLSRETGFKERSVEQFNQVPLYIPEYQRWSRTLGAVVGSAPPSQPKFRSFSGWSGVVWEGAKTAAEKATKAGTEMTTARSLSQSNNIPEYGPWIKYLEEYANWQTSQRTLPV